MPLEDVDVWRWDGRPRGRMPIVRITGAGGGVTYANPVDPAGTFGPLLEGMRVRDAEAAGEGLPVTVTLQATRADAPEEPFDLVTATWSAHDVAGRQVVLGLRPGVSLRELGAARYSDIRTFVPTLSVQALDEASGGIATGAAAALSAAGDAVTLGGERVPVDAAGNVSVDGRPLARPSESADAGRVARVEVEADAGRYPDVRLLVRPLDARGEVVDGLPASAFAVAEDGAGVGFSLSANRAAPRVLFLADSSLSMPEAFRGGRSGMDALIERVRARVRGLHPDAEVEVQTTGSSLWSELAKASGAAVTLIVYATDGDLNGGDPTPDMLEALRQGPPALILDVDGELEAVRARGWGNVFDALAEATGGEAFSVTEGSSEQAEEAVVEYLSRSPVPDPHRIVYATPGAAPGTRTARVRIGGASGEATCEVPETPGLPRRLASLRVVVEVGGNKKMRVIAGYDGVGGVTQRHLDATQGALFGTHILAFEGPPPGLAQLLDDVLAAKSTYEPLEQAAARGADADGLQQALDAGLAWLPGELATLLLRTRPLSGPTFATAEEGLRTVLYTAHPTFGTNRFTTRVDILPLARGFVLAETQEEKYRRALLHSADLAVAEAELFPTSTRSLLAGKPLTRIGRSPFRDRGLPEETVSRWYELTDQIRREYPAAWVAPEAGDVVAMWTVHRRSGELLGVLPDGSGGGTREDAIQRELESLDQVVATLNLLVMAAGAAGAVSSTGGVGLSLVGAYGQQLARLYAAASMFILLMDTSGLDAAVRKALATMACEVVKNITLGVFSGAGRVAGRAVTLFGTVEGVDGAAGGRIQEWTGVENPFSCG